MLCAAEEDLAECEAAIARCPEHEYAPLVPRPSYPEAGFFFVVRPGDGWAVDVGSPALVFRADESPDAGLLGGEPRRRWVTRIAQAAQEAGRDASDYDARERAFTEVAEALCPEHAPSELQAGALIEVLGRRGWRRARVGTCNVVESGHSAYLTIGVSGGPRDGLLARLPGGALPEGSASRDPELAAVASDALPHLRDELRRLGLPHLASLGPGNVGRIPSAAHALLHIGVASEYGDPITSRAECRGVGSCETALILFDPEGGASEVLLRAEEEGVWSVLATLRLGDAQGAILRLDDLGHEEAIFLTIDPQGRLRGQQLFYMMGG